MDNKNDILESMLDDIQKEMLEYHNVSVLTGRMDLANVVAICLEIVRKRFDAEIKSEEVNDQNNEH